MTSPAASSEPLAVPPPDVRLVAPESRYEADEGRLVYVAPADEPHASRHSKLSALLEAHVADGYDVASDMLTRTSEIDDVAPDASVFPLERDPQTGGRRLEELAFEVVSTERLGHAGRKAQKLIARGVRRVFALDVERQRAFEWSRDLGTWEILAPSAVIADPALAAPLPIEALVRAAKADDAIARALLRKKNPVLVAAIGAARADGRSEGKLEGRLEGLLEGLLVALAARGLSVTSLQRSALLGTDDVAQVDAWLAAATTATSVEQLLQVRPRSAE